MSDLTKLTAEELASLHDGRGSLDSWSEIRRRLERLEQCEALLNAYRKIHDGNAIDDSSGAIDQCGCKLCDAARTALEEK